VLVDSGYVGQPFAQGVRDTLGEAVTVQVAKRSELHTFKVMPKSVGSHVIISQFEAGHCSKQGT
jgi:hypothetical protein